MNNECFLRRMHKKTSSLVKIILLFKYSTSKAPLLIFISVFLKLYGLVIISSNFVHIANTEKVSQLSATSYYRTITFYGIAFKHLSYPIYYAICWLIYVFEASFALYIIIILRKIKLKQFNDLTINCFGRWCFYINLILGQHILEWLSFIIFALARNSLAISNELYPNNQSNTYELLTFPKEVFINVIYLIFNIIVYIFVNFIICYSFYILNSSFFSHSSPMRYRHLAQTTFSVLCQIIYSFHYVEILISGNKIPLILYKAFIHVIIIGFLLFYYFMTLKRFEFTNWLGWMTKFILYFCLFSAILEIFIAISSYELTKVTLLIIFIMKLFISYIFTKLYYYLVNRRLLVLGSDFLFTLNDETKINELIEACAFVIHLLRIGKNEQDKSIKELVSMILDHGKDCKENAICKCKIINILPHSTQTSKDFEDELYKRIGFLIETTFIHLDIMKNFDITFLLAEYYYVIDHNAFMAYIIIQSYIAVNRTKMYFTQFIEFYSLQLKYLETCYASYRKDESYVKFSSLLKETEQRKEINKLVLEYCENFIQLVNTKEAIETSIKLDYKDNGEIKEISSKYLTNPITNKIVNSVITQGFLFLSIDEKYTHTAKESTKVEFFYQMFLFYSFFDLKIHSNIRRALSNLTKYEAYKQLSQDIFQRKFEDYLNQYFHMKKKDYHMIIKCNNGFTIEYFSSELSKRLNYNQSSLIGEPFFTIFPPEFRDIHKNAVLKELIKEKYYYSSKSTYIFDSNGYSYICKVESSILPHLSKSLLVICEVSFDLDELENHQSFMLNHAFDLISISKNLEQKFGLSMDLIKKCEIDILELFEIQRGMLLKSFSSFIKNIDKLQEKYQGDTNKIFSKWFFLHKHLIEDSSDILSKQQTIKKCAKTMKYPIQELSSESKTIDRKQISVLHNIVKVLSRYSEIDLHDETYKKYTDSFYHFQTSLNATTIGNLKQKNNGEEMIYHIKIEAKCIYHTPIYICSFQLKQPQSVFQIGASFIEKKMKELQAINISNNPSEPEHNKAILSSKNQLGSIQNYLIADNNPKKLDQLYSDENIIYQTITKVFFVSSLIFGFGLFIGQFIFHNIFFFKINSIITTMDSNSSQRDTLNQVHSAYLSLMSHLADISINEYPIEAYVANLHVILDLLQSSQKRFTSSYMDYCIHFNKTHNVLKESNLYTSIFLDFHNITYESDYSSEINKLLYVGYKTVYESFDNPEISNELFLLFQQRYLLTPDEPINTSLSLFGYYIMNNINRLYQYTNMKLFAIFIEQLATGRQMYILSAWIIELVIFCYYLSFFILFYIILSRMNRDIFYMVIEMFLYSKKNKRETIRSSGGNVLLKLKIHLFCDIINNFNEENCLEIQKKQREKVTNVPDDMATDITSHSIITSVNMTHNSNQQNLSTNKMITKNNSSTYLRRLNTRQESKPTIISAKEKSTIIMKNSLWSTPKFIKYFKVKHLWSVFVFKLFTWLSLLICVLFSIMRIMTAKDYADHIELIQINFDYLTGKYTLAITLFNSIRGCLFNNIKYLHLVGNYTYFMISITEGQSIYDDTFLHFPLTGKLIEQTRLKNTDPNFDPSVLCGKDEYCQRTVSKENSYCADGIDFGILSILQKYFQIINDFTVLEYQSITMQEIKEYFMDNNMNLVEETVDFVLLRVQQQLYITFNYDSQILRKSSEVYVFQMTYPTMLITLGINIIFILVIYINLSKSYADFSREVNKINNSFYNYSTN